MNRRKLGIATLMLVVVAALAASAAGQRAQARLAAQYPPSGQMVEVGGYRLHLHCLGEGGPAVVFDGGAGFAPGLALAHLQQAVSAHTRACVYDRAGQGWSDPSPRPRTSAVIAEELHRLLERAGVPRPYVLAGWSYGGLNMRLYAYRYPEEVAGLVLIDASHERQLEVLGGRPSPVLQAVFRAIPGLIATGVPALVPQWVPRVDAGALPDEAAHASQALAVTSPKMAEAALAELQAIEASMADVAAARTAAPSPQPFGDLPLVVLMKGHTESIQGLSLSAEEQQRRWHDLQSDLAGQSTRGQLIVAEDSGHNIPYQQPELVVAALIRVLDLAEAPHAR
jgi:pimeloyl-ACP methyl ester carboxylesterase